MPAAKGSARTPLGPKIETTVFGEHIWIEIKLKKQEISYN
jgi:hypothetical protein